MTQDDLNKTISDRFAIQDYFTELAKDEEPLAAVSPQPLPPNSVVNAGNAPHPQSAAHRRVNLPERSLPSFPGRYEDWLPFYDSFKSLIHDQDDLSKIDKLHCLKGEVKSEAANQIKHVSITDENNDRAWHLL